MDVTQTVYPDPPIIKTSLQPTLWIYIIEFIDPPLMYINLPFPQIKGKHLIGHVS